jgi:predicted permease
MRTLWQDLRYGLRMLRKSLGFTAVAVLTLALGIGATAAIFSLVNGVLLKPLPYPHSERLVDVRLNPTGINQRNWPLSPADYFIYREQSRTFQNIGLALYANSKGTGQSATVTGLGEPEHLQAVSVTHEMLPILGVTPLVGRSFTPADDQPGSPETVMLSYGYWQRKFGRDRSVIGQSINVNRVPRTIIGVLPQRFRFLDLTDIAMLLPWKLTPVGNYLGNYIFVGIARLKPGVTLAEANADVARMIPIVFRSFPPPPGFSPKTFEDLRIEPAVRPLKQDIVGEAGKVLWVLMGGIALVLVVACANLANFLLVRAEGRQQELAVRTVLGASQGRIAAELFSESLILAVFGGLFGLGLAYGALRVLVAMAPPALPRLNEIGIDGRVVIFTLAVSLAASLLFGCAPAFKYAGASLNSALRAGGRSMSESRERHRSRGVLVIVQVALALVLLACSALMFRTFRALTRVDPGFVTPAKLLTFHVQFPSARFKDAESVLRIQEPILHKLEVIPGVSSVGLTRSLPMDGSTWNSEVFAKEGTYSRPGTAVPVCRFGFVSPDFFNTLGTPLIAGRDFTWSDIDDKRPVAMVSEKMAREYWQDPASALGKEISESSTGPWRKVIGVVADVHQDGIDKEATTYVYWPILPANFGGDPDGGVQRDVAFVIRSTRAGSETFVRELRRAVWSVDSSLPLFEVHTLDFYYSKSMARTSFTLVMLALASGMALVLSIVGLYGSISYSVAQRTHEIGIRMALGAQRGNVMRLVLGQGTKLVLFGAGVGALASLGLTRLMSSLLFGVSATDPLTFVAVAIVLVSVALLACYIPARRAMRVDPMVALRYE